MDEFPVRIEAAACRTGLGSAEQSRAALAAGRRALRLHPVFGAGGGDSVPLALAAGRSLEETAPPNWLGVVDALAREVPEGPWGSASHPVFVTSSNFGVGNLYAYQRGKDAGHLTYGAPHLMVEFLRRRLAWGADTTPVSHACVSAHLGLTLAARRVRSGGAARALVFSFDFISPFVAGGFHALKILNSEMPAPYADRAVGSIGLGDGAAFAVLGRDRGDFLLGAQNHYNEMHHFTANQASGEGFERCLSPIAKAAEGRRIWIKGHGTGTLEAGKLEAETFRRMFPQAPLVSWKGSLGHTLGSCGLVELAIVLAAWKEGATPGTVGSEAPLFTENVAIEPFPNAAFDGVLLASNAFGGAHAACLLTHA